MHCSNLRKGFLYLQIFFPIVATLRMTERRNTGVHLGPCQASLIELFCENNYRLKVVGAISHLQQGFQGLL